MCFRISSRPGRSHFAAIPPRRPTAGGGSRQRASERRGAHQIALLATAAAILASSFAATPAAALGPVVTPSSRHIIADFEDGDLEGGRAITGFTVPDNVESLLLSGRALSFEGGDQIAWARAIFGDQYVAHSFSFDYAAYEAGGVITHFLDSPRIKRTDIAVELGRHHVEIIHDLANLRAWVFVDGVSRPEFVTILAKDEEQQLGWNTRIANQPGLPGGSRGAFEIDDLTWKSNADVRAFLPVPETGSGLLLGLGLAALSRLRTRQLSRPLRGAAR